MKFLVFQRNSVRVRAILFTLAVFLASLWTLSSYASEVPAFDPQKRLLAFTLVLTVLSGWLGIWLMRTLGQREKALQESEERYRTLVDWTPEANAVHRDGKLLYANSAALRRLGAGSIQELLGKSILDLIHPDYHQVALERVRLASTGAGAMPVIEQKFVALDGTIIDVEVQSIGIIYDGKPAIFTVAHDISKRKLTEKREQFRHNILELLAGNETLTATLDAIARGVEALDPSILCSILLFDPQSDPIKAISQVVAPSLPGGFNTAMMNVEAGRGFGSCGTAAFTGERVIIEDIRSHPYWEPYRELVAKAGLGACRSEPIRSASGKVLGTFGIYYHEAHTPTESETEFIEQAARLASIAIEKSLATEKLHDSEKRFRLLMEDIPSLAVQGYAMDGTVTFWNHASELLYGYSEAEAMGANLLNLIIPPKMKEGVGQAIQTMIETGEPIPASELLLQNKDGKPVPVYSSHALTKASTRQAELFCLDIDLAPRKLAEEKMFLAASVFSHVREGITITDVDGNIIDVNKAFTRITGYARDEVLGNNPRILKSGRQSNEFYANMWRSLIDTGQWSGEIWNRRKNGEIYAEMLNISAVRDSEGKTHQYVALFSDISEQKKHQQQLEHMAHFDELTDLPNRVLLADRMQQAIVQAQRHGQWLAVVYLDIDGFKSINDLHGHDIGNRFLVTVAARMKQVLRESDTLARLGGDEFVAILLDLDDVSASVPMLERLLAAAAQPMFIGDTALQVTASLGLTFYPQTDDVDADQLLRQADQAMYQAKLAGKNRYHVFDAELDRSVRGHHESVERIRQALNAREFVLHYQPKVNMRTGTLIGAEALIRWQHPERGLLPPAAFLPEIEDNALAIEVGKWVIDAALSQMEEWHAAGLTIPVSVNIGARQLQQTDFVSTLREILARHPGVGANQLEMEVLETSALEDLERVSRVIESCREIGVLFALDDFGTGYSSLTYLKSLAVNQLKIDQSFVRDMLADPDDLSILGAVLSLATAFHREVIAEGVETIEHGTMLLQLGCELAQGYGIARPMPPHLLPAWAASWRPEAAWSNLPAVNRDDLPLLFASVEHRAWIVAFEEFIRGERDALPLVHHQCRFGAWLDTEGRSRHGELPVFLTIEAVHRELHAVAAELLGLHFHGQTTEALSGLGRLHGLRDALFEHLQVLAQENPR